MVDDRVIGFRQDAVVVTAPHRDVGGMVERTLLQLRRQGRRRNSSRGRLRGVHGSRGRVGRVRVRREPVRLDLVSLQLPLAPLLELGWDLLRPCRKVVFVVHALATCTVLAVVFQRRRAAQFGEDPWPLGIVRV